MTSCSDVRAAVRSPSSIWQYPTFSSASGTFAGLRILLDDLAELGQSVGVLAAHVVRLGEPILRVVGERARRELRQKRLERCAASSYLRACIKSKAAW